MIKFLTPQKKARGNFVVGSSVVFSALLIIDSLLFEQRYIFAFLILAPLAFVTWGIILAGGVASIFGIFPRIKVWTWISLLTISVFVSEILLQTKAFYLKERRETFAENYVNLSENLEIRRSYSMEGVLGNIPTITFLVSSQEKFEKIIEEYNLTLTDAGWNLKEQSTVAAAWEKESEFLGIHLEYITEKETVFQVYLSFHGGWWHDLQFPKHVLE